jgi:hypothetical protein
VIAGPVLDDERLVVSAADRSITTVMGRLFGIMPVDVAQDSVGSRRLFSLSDQFLRSTEEMEYSIEYN